MSESTRAALKIHDELKNFKKPCIMYQTMSTAKTCLTVSPSSSRAMKVQPASITSFKRGASDFSAQVAKMKSDGCDMVLLARVIANPSAR